MVKNHIKIIILPFWQIILFVIYWKCLFFVFLTTHSCKSGCFFPDAGTSISLSLSRAVLSPPISAFPPRKPKPVVPTPGPRPYLAHVCCLAAGHAASWCQTLWGRLLAPYQEQGDAHQAGRQAASQFAHDRNHTSLVPACFSVLIKVLNDYGWVKRPFLKEGVEVTDWILPPMPSIKPGVPETVAHLPCSTALLFLASESSTLRITLWSAK